MGGFSAVVCALLLMVFIQGSNCCCNVDTGTGYVNCSISSNSAHQCNGDSKGREFNCDDGTTVEFHGVTNISNNITLMCDESTRNGVLQNSDKKCSPDSFMCPIDNCDDMQSIQQYKCTLATDNSDETSSSETEITTKNPTDSEDNEMSSPPSTLSYSSNRLTSTGQPDIIRTPSSSGDIIPVLLAVIIGLMALFICIMVATMIIRKLRKRKHRYTINNSRDLIHQENIYQMGDGNRRPSRIIPIVTHGGECLEMTEFPRYNDIGMNHHKLSNASLSMSYEKGGYLADQVVNPMATASNPNGGYPQEHFYSIIPANKVDHPEHHAESKFPVQHDHHHQHHHPRVRAPQIHITHSSQSSLNDNIDPYSTLDEARNEAMVEIRSTHTIDEQSDDILMLNMFGSDKPKWIQDARPLRLNVPTNRKVISGRISVGSEDEYITMTGSGDLDGGWGEVRTRAHASGFDTTDRLRQGYEHKNGFDLSEKAQYNKPMHVANHPPQEVREKEMEADEVPPSPDKSIEDLYAKVRKKSKKSKEYSESSDDEVTFIIDENGSPSRRECLIPPNQDFSEATKKDQASQKGQKYEEVTPVQPLTLAENGSTNQKGERSAHMEVQTKKAAKHATENTHTQ